MSQNAVNKGLPARPAKSVDKSGGSAGERTLVALLKAAADPLRLEILRVLSHDSFGVQELADIFSMPQPGMSHHLKILSQCGLLVTRREGNSIFYRRPILKGADELSHFQSTLYRTVDTGPLSTDTAKRISSVVKARALQSQDYFQKNAARFQEKQGLLCEPEQYFGNLVELVDVMELPATAKVLEVGPGQGTLLAELSKRFQKLVAVDNSGKMLDLARGQTKASGKIEFVNSSLEAYSPPASSFDAAVLNMVLHHIPSPGRAFQKLAQLVKRGGYVLVADLCPHNQEWAKAACGDVWLGFDPEELKEVARVAGFGEEQSSYLGLKNGFQIQLRLFGKE